MPWHFGALAFVIWLIWTASDRNPPPAINLLLIAAVALIAVQLIYDRRLDS